MIKTNETKSIVLTLLIAGLLASCSSTIERQEMLDKNTKNEYEFQKMKADSLSREITRKRTRTDYSLESKLPYVSNRTIKTQPRLPNELSAEVMWYFPESSKLSFPEFKRMVFQKTGFRVLVDGELKLDTPSVVEDEEKDSTGASFEVLKKQKKSKKSKVSEVSSDPLDKIIILDQKQFLSVKNILNNVSAQIGYEWEVNHNDHAIEFKQLFTKSYVIEAPVQSDDLLPNTIFVGGDKQKTPKLELSSKLWESVEGSILSFLTQKGHVTINERARLVTVTDTKQAIRKTDEYMRELNISLSSSVLVNVEIIEYQFEDSANLGLDLTLSLLKNNSNLIFSAVNGVLNQSIVAPLTGVKEGSWQGSQSVINALNKTGRVVKTSKHPVRARNNTIGSLSKSRIKGFLESVSQPVTGVSGTTSGGSLKQGYVRSGKTINILPHILSDRDTLLLDIGINMSSLNKFDDITDGFQSLQAPDVNIVQISKSLKIRSGETMILTSIDENESKNEKSGWLDSAFWWLGGNDSQAIYKSVTVITITPYIF